MERFDFLVLGGAGTHHIMKVDKIPDDDVSVYVQNPDYDQLFCGGTGFNVVYSLVKVSGRKTVLLTSSDRRNGEVALEKLKDSGVDISHIELVSGNCAGYIIEDDAGRRLTVLGGTHADIHGCEMPDELFENCNIAIFTIDEKVNVENFLEKLEEHKTPFAFCMRSDRTIFTDELLRRAVPQAKLLFCNEFEKSLLEEVLGLNSIADLLNNSNLELIAVTCGRKGAKLYEKNGRITQVSTTETKKVVDRIGAGDAFIAGYMFGYSEAMSPVECAKLGATLSSFVIEKVGCTTGSPTREALLERYYARSDVEESVQLH